MTSPSDEYSKTCDTEHCDEPSDLGIWINDDQGNRIVDEAACMGHVLVHLRKNPDKDVPWPLLGPYSMTPWRFIKCGEALRLLGEEFPSAPWFPPGPQ